MATMSNDPGPNDPAAIRATALALLDCVEDRLSSPQGSTAFTGLADCMLDHTYPPRGNTASTDLVTSTADDVGLLSTPAGNLVLEDQYGTYALRLAALDNQLQDWMARWAADHLTNLMDDVKRDGNHLRQQVHSDCTSRISQQQLSPQLMHCRSTSFAR